jgi:predicted amino acid dehydrogenase
MVRASTLEVFSAVAPALKEIGMEEVGIGGFWKHVFFWWTKKNRAAK